MEVWNSNPSYPYMGRSPTWSTSVTLWQTSKIASYTDSGEMMMLLTIASLMTSNRRRRGPCKSHWWIGKGQKRQDYAVTIFLQLISRQRRKIPTNSENVIRTWKGEYWNLELYRQYGRPSPNCQKNQNQGIFDYPYQAAGLKFWKKNFSSRTCCIHWRT